jgi:capsular exopolysaccharide synthesis family protein
VYVSQYLRVLSRRAVDVVITLLVVVGLAWGITALMPTKYTANTRLFFAVPSESVSDLAQGSSFAARQVASYAEVVRSPYVLAPVIQKLGLPVTTAELADSITATVPLDTVTLEIAVSYPDQNRVADIAEAIAQQLSAAATQLSPARSGTGQAVEVTILEHARRPAAPSSPNLLLNLGVGIILGLMAGIGVALVRDNKDTPVRSHDDVRAVTDVPVLATVPLDRAVSEQRTTGQVVPSGSSAEAIRQLRSRLRFLHVWDRSQPTVITSAVANEGGTTVAVNLAIFVAETGLRVVLVDANLRQPAVAGRLGLDSGEGLAGVLSGRTQLDSAIRRVGESWLDVLPAGNELPPNPSELLAGYAIEDLLKQLQQSYEVVLIDAPPLLRSTDAAVLGNLAGRAVLVVGLNQVRRADVAAALESLEATGADVLGMVLNKAKHVRPDA